MNSKSAGRAARHLLAALFAFVFANIVFFATGVANAEISCHRLRCEYRENPLGIDEPRPRLSWQIRSPERGQKQSHFQILVASTLERLDANQGDLWDSGQVKSNETLHIEYEGQKLRSGQVCFWKVRSWNQQKKASPWSESATWTVGLLNEADWKASYISFKDDSPIFKNREAHYLPPATRYRKQFAAEKEIIRATVYATALGIFELELNGQRVSDEYFAPGWTDYRQRAYYKTYDVTQLVNRGENAIGATVADGWYSGYVGFGLLVGIGTEKIGRYTYGKTPALMAQLEIEFSDGSKQLVVTDRSWKVSNDGPIRQADLLMGEFYDARMEQEGWSTPSFDDGPWKNAIKAEENGTQPADFYEFVNPPVGQGPQIKPRPIDLGFRRPRLESFPGEPVVITEEISPVKIIERGEGKYIFDLGQNFAGNIRFQVKGPRDHQITIRYAEMLHPDGRMMTENLRKARATDYYVCKGSESVEHYSPRFTFHGFQYVEVENFPGKPDLDSVTGLVIHSDTKLASEFECSDPMVNQLFQNVIWTQRSNFIDLPTDCPQRDERMGWTGDAQAYVATAAYNADVGAFFTKWNRELMESQRPSGAFPGYAPFPFQHGWDFGSAWADAGIICPWTIWQAYGDTRMIDRCWAPMTKFMKWRQQASIDNLGVVHGNPWGDWLSQGEVTPLDFIDSVYLAISTRMMAEMAMATNRQPEAEAYAEQLETIKKAFQERYVRRDGSIRVPTQTAHALAIYAELIPEDLMARTGEHLASMLAENGNHMATGFLGTRPLLPALSATGQNDLATFLLQSHEFPSWGYEIDQGATSIWERWDSFTKEDGFGRHNAAMNSFSHYAFGAVCEWMFRTLAGIESDGPGYQEIIIRPFPPRPSSNAMHEAIHWTRASYDSIRGTIKSQWKLENGEFKLQVSIPANTTATVFLPTSDADTIRESGKNLSGHPHVKVVSQNDRSVQLLIESGDYEFAATSNLTPAKIAIKTSRPKDNSLNPERIDLKGATRVVNWDFSLPTHVQKWSGRNNVDIEMRAGKAFLVATGDDPQISTELENSVGGKLVLELKALPAKGAESQFFWASETGGFNATQQSKRQLRATDQVNSYLFRVHDDSTLGKLRFDPFSQFDEHANRPEMQIESISIYRLPKETPNQDKSSKRETSQSDLPNILFFLSEDQGAHLGRLGTAGLRTPNIDSLAQGGMYFENAFVVYPVCSASKAALYTGLHCHTNGILNNTHNFHKPASEVTEGEKNIRLAQINRVRDQFQTLPEILKANGYYQGVTHKLHVLPNEKFPFDEFINESQVKANSFIQRGARKNQPWFLMVNMPYSHRPYPNSDKKPIRVDHSHVKLPAYLPDTPEVRKDWAEYLAGIEMVDGVVGRTIQALKETGQFDNTIIIYLSDHGPTFPHGKMTLYDLGLRVPMIIRGPGIRPGVSDQLVTEMDLLPTLLDLLAERSAQPLKLPGPTNSPHTPSTGKGWNLPYRIDGNSLKDLLTETNQKRIRNFVFAEISNRGPLPNDGIQERSVFDGRWKLIYRENVDKGWRQVNADSRQFEVWGNRSYAETLRVKDEFPEAFRVLAEMDPQKLGGQVLPIELYDLLNDPNEMNNLADNSTYQVHADRLMQALQEWAERTEDVTELNPNR